MVAPRWLFVASAVVYAVSGRAAAAELPFELANARTSPVRVTVVLARAPVIWSRGLQLSLAAGVAAAPTAGLGIDDVLLEAETGAQATAKATVAPTSELSAGRTAAVTLTATFAVRGLYRGEIVLRQGELRRVVPLEVNVTAPGPTPIEAEGGHTIAITEPVFDDGSGVSAILQLRNKGHDALIVRSVELASATRVDKPVGPGMTLQTPSARLAAEGAGRPLEPGGVSRVPIELSGINEPGIYLVDVAVQAEGHEPEQITVTVYRRTHWLWAALSIAAGAVIAAGVRAFTTGGRDRLKLRRQLAALRDGLRALRHQAVEPEHEAAGARLAAELDQRGRELRWIAIRDTEAAIVTLEQRIELFGEIMTAARQAGRLDDERRAAPRQVLSQALAKVRVPAAAADVEAARKAVVGLALDDAWRAQLSSILRELDAQVSSHLSQGGAALRAAIVERVQPLQISAHGFLRQDRLGETAAALEGIQVRLREIAVAELRRQIAGAAPVGVTEQAWARARESVAQLLEGNVDAPGWGQQLRQAQRVYLRAAVLGLVQHAETNAAQGQASDTTRLQAIAAELRSLLDAGDSGVDAAAALYQQRLRDVSEASEPVVARHQVGARVGGGEGQGPGEGGGWSWISLLLSDVPMRGVAASPTDVKQIEATYRRTSWFVHAAVLAVAVLSGMKALWIGNPTWGTDHAWLIAFLWGAGVGAVGDAFTGIIGLREKLGAPRE